MPYQRSTDASSHHELVAAFEGAIRNLVRRFRNHPYAFYTETDMHCYIYIGSTSRPSMFFTRHATDTTRFSCTKSIQPSQGPRVKQIID